MMKAKDFYKGFIDQLALKYNRQEAVIIADWVFECKASIKKFDFIRNPALRIDGIVMAALESSLIELLQNKPVQYVTGEAWFCKLKLKVNKHVLVPRPETEELVELISKYAYGNICRDSPIRILDIGTGSGCIAIALKINLPDAAITAIDICEKALFLAKENATEHQVNIHFAMLDFLVESNWRTLPKFDIIVSNPPYIPVQERKLLEKNVTDYEPHIALFVPDHTPLLFYEKISAFAKNHLNENGKIFVETHEAYAAATAEMFLENFKEVLIKKDIFGKERMLEITQCR